MTLPVKICLNMIVKDESKIIERCMNSMMHMLDAVAISDTGSSDNTVAIIKNWIKTNKLKGGVESQKWKDFSHNRNLALDYAKSTVDSINNKATWYFLFMDADDIILGTNPDKPMLIDKSVLTDDFYQIDMKCGSLTYNRTFLVKHNKELPWHYQYVLHECITPKDPTKPLKMGKLKGGYIKATRDGARGKDSMKYLNDVVTLERHLKESKAKSKGEYKESTRDIFYLAQSYRDSGVHHLLKVAENMYIKRTTMKGYPEEIYISYIEAAKCRIRRNKHDHQALKYLMQAFEERPQRLEAPHWIVNWYRLHKFYKMGYTFGKPLIKMNRPANDKLFVDDIIHDWKFLEEVAICAFYAGDKSFSLKLYQKIINKENINLGLERQRILKSMASVRQALGIPSTSVKTSNQSKPKIVLDD